jgi:sec-independent protein translocase protein TatC
VARTPAVKAPKEEIEPEPPKLDPQGEMSFMQHLGALRVHVVRSAIWLSIGGVGAYFLINPVWNLLLQPLCDIRPNDCATYPRDLTESMWVFMKLGVVLAIFVAMPGLIFEFWSFVAPGLYKHEKRMLIPASLIFGVLFAGGAAFGFYVVFPPAFAFMLSVETWGSFKMMITMQNYFSMCTTLLLAFGAIFELPLVMTGISWLGLVKPRWYTRYRRAMWFAMMVFAAAATPTTDPLTMMLMGCPMIVLYEVGIIASRIAYRPRLYRTDDDA